MDGGIGVFLNGGTTPPEALEFQGEPLGPEGASNLVSGKSGLLWTFEGPLGIPLELVQGTRASCRGEARDSGFLSCSDMDLRVPMEIRLGSQTSSHIEAWNCPSFSRCKMGVRPPVELRLGSGPISRGTTGLSVLPSCWEHRGLFDL